MIIELAEKLEDTLIGDLKSEEQLLDDLKWRFVPDKAEAYLKKLCTDRKEHCASGSTALQVACEVKSSKDTCTTFVDAVMKSHCKEFKDSDACTNYKLFTTTVPDSNTPKTTTAFYMNPLIIGGVVAGVAIIFIGIGVYFFFLRSSSPPPPQPRMVPVAPTVTPTQNGGPKKHKKKKKKKHHKKTTSREEESEKKTKTKVPDVAPDTKKFDPESTAILPEAPEPKTASEDIPKASEPSQPPEPSFKITPQIVKIPEDTLKSSEPTSRPPEGDEKAPEAPKTPEAPEATAKTPEVTEKAPESTQKSLKFPEDVV